MSTGVDPELLIESEAGNIIPASRLGLPASTSEHVNSRTAFIYDNAALEFRAKTNHCLEKLQVYLHRRLTKIRLMAQKALGEDGWRITLAPAGRLHHSTLHHDPTILAFGCSPSMVVGPDGEAEEFQPDLDGAEVPFRSAGYHVHQSTKGGSTASPRSKPPNPLIVQALDNTVGVASTLMECKAGFTDEAHLRRSVLGYGQAGEYRDRPFGVEYRVPGPWVMIQPIWTWWLHSGVRMIANRCPVSEIERVAGILPREEVVRAINEPDEEVLHQLWREIASTLVRDPISVVMTAGYDVDGYPQKREVPLGEGNNSFAPKNLERFTWIAEHGGPLAFLPEDDPDHSVDFFDRWDRPGGRSRIGHGKANYRTLRKTGRYYFPSGTTKTIGASRRASVKLAKKPSLKEANDA